MLTLTRDQARLQMPMSVDPVGIDIVRPRVRPLHNVPLHRWIDSNDEHICLVVSYIEELLSEFCLDDMSVKHYVREDLVAAVVQTMYSLSTSKDRGWDALKQAELYEGL